MDLADAIRGDKIVLTEGALIERLRRDPSVQLDANVLHAGFVYQLEAQQRLAELYRQYLEVGRDAGRPMIVGTPTWRANSERLRAARLADRDVNADNVAFVREQIYRCGPYASRVMLGGLMGCRGDAYRPAETLSADEAREFHLPQARALAAGGVDFLHAATLPAVAEALGLARAMATCGRPYVLSFVLRPTGTCLDGTPLEEAVSGIDREVSPPPTAYFVNCVHPAVLIEALRQATARDAGVRTRVVGLQANTSALSPEELDSRPVLDCEAPEPFAEAMAAAAREFDLRVLGGCCGTDHRHIAAIARRLATR